MGAGHFQGILVINFPLPFRRALCRALFRLLRIFKDGFRPVGGNIADFATARHKGRDHFFYIERRLHEGTPFFPDKREDPDLFGVPVCCPVASDNMVSFLLEPRGAGPGSFAPIGKHTR